MRHALPIFLLLAGCNAAPDTGAANSISVEDPYAVQLKARREAAEEERLRRIEARVSTLENIAISVAKERTRSASGDSPPRRDELVEQLKRGEQERRLEELERRDRLR